MSISITLSHNPVLSIEGILELKLSVNRHGQNSAFLVANHIRSISIRIDKTGHLHLVVIFKSHRPLCIFH